MKRNLNKTMKIKYNRENIRKRGMMSDVV